MPAVTLVHEAGGVMSDWLGQPLSMDSDGRVVAASSLALHRELLAILSGKVAGKVD
jgi:fructose-1,6-bisphosphatase/inositol monophosphatase family enzyme